MSLFDKVRSFFAPEQNTKFKNKSNDTSKNSKKQQSGKKNFFSQLREKAKKLRRSEKIKPPARKKIRNKELEDYSSKRKAKRALEKEFDIKLQRHKLSDDLEVARRLGIKDNSEVTVNGKDYSFEDLYEFLYDNGIDPGNLIGAGKDFKYKAMVDLKDRTNRQNKLEGIREILRSNEVDEDEINDNLEALTRLMYGDEVAFDYRKIY